MASVDFQGPDPRANPADAYELFGIQMPKVRMISLVIGLGVAIVLPFMVTNFAVFQMTQVLVYAIAVLGLNLLTGYNGQFSLGHSAFYALGAYTTAILIDRYEVAYYWTIIPAGVICFVAGFLFGLPALRLDGLYLALATFALAVATPQLLKYEHFEDFTGGVQGIDVFKPDSPIEWLSKDQFFYFFTLICTVVLIVTAWNLVRGRTGRAMIAIRDNPIAAKTMGINTSLYKSVTFGVSGFYTGIAGALAAIITEYVAPDSFTFFLSVWLLVGMVVGGLASIPAAIAGGVLILYLPNMSEEVIALFFGDDPSAKALVGVAFGLFLIFTVYVVPNGLAGLVRQFIVKLARRPGA
ncbi:MAG: branched-chain amino acid ABC transporter permease [Proteobacteria bacterium]|nr:branched-chain amino acid ABC transporter permease [Pseudomonadota bacterium]